MMRIVPAAEGLLHGLLEGEAADTSVNGDIASQVAELSVLADREEAVTMKGKSPGGRSPVFDAQRVPAGGRRRLPLRLGVVEGCFLFVLEMCTERARIAASRETAGTGHANRPG